MKITEDTSEKEELYYIQTQEYIGNAICWWGKNHSGYTANLKNAGRYTKEEAMRIINNRPEQESAWLCSDIDGCTEAHVLTVEPRNLNFDLRITTKRII